MLTLLKFVSAKLLRGIGWSRLMADLPGRCDADTAYATRIHHTYCIPTTTPNHHEGEIVEKLEEQEK